jgi:DNA-binding CsgD family transcriptional regulator
VRIDAIRVIEACYAPVDDERRWLQDLLTSLDPLTRGFPAVAQRYDLVGGRLQDVVVFGPAGCEVPAAPDVKRFWEAADPEIVRLWFSPVPPVAMASRYLKRTPPKYRDEVRGPLDRHGIREALALLTLEPEGRGLAITVPYGEPVRLPPRTLHRLGRVTAHLGTALRLRSRASAPAGTGDAEVEAVLGPDGRVHHATSVAREPTSLDALSQAVRTVEHARGRLRRTDPDEAVALWQGLVDGRWSLVDHSEADGRRFVLARRNEPGARDPKALAPRERTVLAFAALGHSNKHIAYVLGMTPSTVAMHLSSAMTKLALRSRSEAIAMFGPMAVGPRGGIRPR